MKAKHLSPLGLICTIAWLATQPVAAQTQNPQAAKWFQAGLKASNAQTKVEAYNQALALDSTMIEAYYNLALVYKQQADFQQAQKYLERAHALPSDNTSLDLKNRIVYDLASLYRRQGKAKESEAILRQAKQEIKDTKMLSSVYFELGKLLLEQERFTEALAELRAGQQLDQGNKTFFTNLIQIAENSAAAQKQYAQARQAEARGSYLEAKAMYELIESLTPEYKDVQARRVRVDSVLNQDLQLQRALAAASHGSHRRPAIDFLIAATAEAAGGEVVLWSFDRDLRVICEYTGQPHESEESAGPGR